MKIGDIVRTSYYLYDLDGDPIGGESGNILTTLEKNGGATGEAVTVSASVGITGKYIVYFTPLTTGHYELFISHATYDPSGQGQDWDITTNDVDTIDTVVDAIKLKTDTISWNDITFLKNIRGGGWEIINNQLIYYESDNETEVCRFNLFDKDGNPTMERVYKRERV